MPETEKARTISFSEAHFRQCRPASLVQRIVMGIQAVHQPTFAGSDIFAKLLQIRRPLVSCTGGVQ
jgi:hypothetical protein